MGSVENQPFFLEMVIDQVAEETFASFGIGFDIAWSEIDVGAQFEGEHFEAPEAFQPDPGRRFDLPVASVHELLDLRGVLFCLTALGGRIDVGFDLRHPGAVDFPGHRDDQTMVYDGLRRAQFGEMGFEGGEGFCEAGAPKFWIARLQRNENLVAHADADVFLTDRQVDNGAVEAFGEVRWHPNVQVDPAVFALEGTRHRKGHVCVRV